MEDNTPEEVSEESQEAASEAAEEESATLWAENLILEKLSENNDNGLSEQVISSVVYIFAMKQFADGEPEQLAHWKESKSIRSVLNRLKREGRLRFSSNRWHVI